MNKVPHPHIIEAKGNRSLLVRMRDVFLTAAMWGAYAYLMQDFFHFITTVYDWKMLGIITHEMEKVLSILQTLEVYLYIIVANSFALIGWALYNQIRFRGKDRRKATPVIGPRELGLHYGVATEKVETWQEMRILIIHHDENGKIVDIVPGGKGSRFRTD